MVGKRDDGAKATPVTFLIIQTQGAKDKRDIGIIFKFLVNFHGKSEKNGKVLDKGGEECYNTNN